MWLWFEGLRFSIVPTEVTEDEKFQEALRSWSAVVQSIMRSRMAAMQMELN